MAYPQGINFRQTVGFVTDISPSDFEGGDLFDPTYPRTTPQGNTVGWEDLNVDSRDRSTTPDVRLAGINFPKDGGADTAVYRFDLTGAGDWKLGLALGDYNGPQGPMRLEIFDTSTSLGFLVNNQTTSASQRFFDASGVQRTADAWPTDHILVTKTFATTICRFRAGGTASGISTIAHAYVEAVGGGNVLMAQILM